MYGLNLLKQYIKTSDFPEFLFFSGYRSSTNIRQLKLW